ncbi:hypothetical protein KD050_06625 [Psychrobacillus sp. INOP01]|uniref:hypothetical protein n=1 Tax=Psychrobacillus sp. INOP01 TaxID=2829187 RepID=UPI001BA7B843|nr:hypothetical protein [Psychrobacillus sp. INOP01]QUG42916.1 hypothetical protein KD050_06625 [Psychrobacillus sp. INOP01]
MKKILSVILLMSISLVGCGNIENDVKVHSEEHSQEETNNQAEKVVRELVETFGSRLQNVSLLGQGEDLEKSMKQSYGELVTPELIEKWLDDPLNAPGRLTSSPWPDRIEITKIQEKSKIVYAVTGEIIEITSGDEVTNKIPIELLVEKISEEWLISDVVMTGADQNNSVVYHNSEYDFSFTLPNTWKNYSIVTDKWEGLSLPTTGKEEVVETGPMISIRHKEWSANDPRQDIPIMILTIEQWDLLQKEKFHIGAAPIPPTELARNDKYVFALPARYNFAFPTGYEEVEQILEGNPIEATEQ